QLLALELFTRRLAVPLVPATAMAVELAVLHNFVWHETWTWKGSGNNWPGRLWRYQLSNGILSIASNTILTYAFHKGARLPVPAANLAAIATGGLLNFAIAHYWVFPGSRNLSPPTALRSKVRSIG
ncbi:MAG TPA: GtrA family protein, partial [Bryobacteraceae bacterium]